MARPHRIVVGIDFGTTYSAVAFASVDSSQPLHVNLISNWPTSGQPVGTQVPTEIAYPEGDTTSFSWGYSISPKARKFKWFKLGLGTDNEVLSLPDGLSSSDLVRDYLSALYLHIMTTLHRRFDRGVMQNTAVDFVLTVPAIWGDAARKKTEDAANRAGLSNEHSLELLSEPESAAVYTLKTLDSSYSEIRVGDRIVVCDAGGGTVDLISYEVRQIRPRLSVAECTPGTGDYCGSSFIDQEFEKLFAARMGEHYGKVSLVHRQQVVRNFELVKMAFRDAPDTPTFFVNVPTVGDIESAGVYSGMFEISRDEMRTLFEPIVVQVIDLINGQISAVSTTTQHRVSSILLVGGFGESEYLYQRIRAWAAPADIQVIQPREASTAIVRGAVMKGLEPKTGPSKTEVSRRARRSYGVPTNQAFIPGKHDEMDLYVDDDTGERLARNQISWFIRKNQVITDEQTFRHAFKRNFKRLTPWTDLLVSSTLDIPPPRWSDAIHKHCTIISDLTRLEAKAIFDRRWYRWHRYYTAEYELVMSLRNNNLTMWLEHKGVKYGVANVEFESVFQ